MVWWCPFVRVSVSHSFPHFSPSCFDVFSWKVNPSRRCLTCGAKWIFVELDLKRMHVLDKVQVLKEIVFNKEKVTFFWKFCCTNVGHFALFIRPSSDGTYYGMVMSVRVSVRPTLRPVSVRPSGSPSVRPGLRPPVFHTFLLHALTFLAEILHMTLF